MDFTYKSPHATEWVHSAAKVWSLRIILFQIEGMYHVSIATHNDASRIADNGWSFRWGITKSMLQIDQSATTITGSLPYLPYGRLSNIGQFSLCRSLHNSLAFQDSHDTSGSARPFRDGSIRSGTGSYRPAMGRKYHALMVVLTKRQVGINCHFSR